MTDHEIFIKNNPLTEVEVATIYTFIKNLRSHWYPTGFKYLENEDDLGDVMDILVTDYE